MRPLDQVHALVVDDEEDHRVMVEMCLETVGATVRVAADADGAIQILRDHPVDVVLLDLTLANGIDGYQVLRQIRAVPGRAQLPVVAFTGHALTEDARRVTAAGFDGLVVKPASFAALVEALRRALAR